eukprot:gb/GECH01011474.1/.p1 GENE.gb/GECH01011474.1/~~gb/GECH01011474.1/.p1  ORF type:complete len:188 (+),score=1.87 gb/GECH01011474.1/:1-564(+)
MTTDAGTDFLRAYSMERMERIWCFNHILNLGMEEFLFKSQINGVFEKCRSISRHFSHSSKSKAKLQLNSDKECISSSNSRSTRKYCKTRWLSSGEMFESVLYNLRGIFSIIKSNEYNTSSPSVSVTRLELQILNQLVPFMVELNQVIKLMEKKDTATLSDVIPSFLKMIKVVQKIARVSRTTVDDSK